MSAIEALMFCPLKEGGGSMFSDVINGRQFSFVNGDPRIWIGSEGGGALSFNGTDQYANISADEVPDVTDHFTLYVKIMIRSRVNWDSYAGRSSSTNWNDGFGFWYDNGNIRFFVGNYTAHRSSIAESLLPYGNWYHFFGVLNRDAVRFIVVDSNGKFILGSEDNYDGDTLNAGNFSIGGSFGGYQDRSDCCVEEFALFDRAFNLENIRQFLGDRSFARTRILYVSAAAPETGLLTVGANAGLTIGGLAGGLGSLTMAAQAGESMAALAAAGGVLTAAAQAGESMAALAAAAASLDAAAIAGETLAALAAAAGAVVAAAEAGDVWTTGATGQLTVGAQAGESFAAAAAAYGALVGAANAAEATSATAAALASLAIDAAADDTFLPDSSAEGGIVLRGAIRLQAALRGKIDIKPLFRGLPGTRPH